MKKNRLKTVIFKQKSLLLYKYCFLCYIEPIWKSDDEESRYIVFVQRMFFWLRWTRRRYIEHGF